jgi:hypothetical protein
MRPLKISEVNKKKYVQKGAVGGRITTISSSQKSKKKNGGPPVVRRDSVESFVRFEQNPFVSTPQMLPRLTGLNIRRIDFST